MKAQRRFLVAAVAVYFAATFGAEAYAATCSCTAKDRSCSVSISCTGGCMVFCLDGGNCSSQCVGGSGGGPGPLTPPPSLVEPPFQPAPAESITLEVREISAQDLADQLSEILGVRLAIDPSRSQEMLSMDAKGVPPAQLLEALTRRGIISAFSPGAGGQAGRAGTAGSGLDAIVSLEGQELTAESLGALLTQILGSEVKLERANPAEIINVQVKEAPVREVLKFLSKLGPLTIDGLSPNDWR